MCEKDEKDELFFKVISRRKRSRCDSNVDITYDYNRTGGGEPAPYGRAIQTRIIMIVGSRGNARAAWGDEAFFDRCRLRFWISFLNFFLVPSER